MMSFFVSAPVALLILAFAVLASSGIYVSAPEAKSIKTRNLDFNPNPNWNEDNSGIDSGNEDGDFGTSDYIWSSAEDDFNKGEGSADGDAKATCSGINDTKEGWDAVTKKDECVRIKLESEMDIYGNEHKLQFTCYETSGVSHQNTYNQEKWSETICMKPGDYQLNAYDSFGDGWNNGKFQVILVSTGEKLVDWTYPPSPTNWASGGANYFLDFEVPEKEICGYAGCKSCVENPKNENKDEGGCKWCASLSVCGAVDSTGAFLDLTCDESLSTKEECDASAPPTITTDFALNDDLSFVEGGDNIELTWASTKLAATKMVRIELVDNPPACYYELTTDPQACDEARKLNPSFGGAFDPYGSNDPYGNNDPYASDFDTFDPYANSDYYYDPWASMSSSESYESFDFYDPTANEDNLRTAFTFGDFANDGSESLPIPEGMTRSSKYAIKISDLTDPTVYAYTGKFSLGPLCYDIELTIDISSESYPNENYWTFEESADRVSFGSSMGSTPDNDNVNTLDIHSGVFNEDMDFGVWAGTYSNPKGVFVYTACFDPGLYTFLASDSYGDGWNGGMFSIKDVTSDLFVVSSRGSQLKKMSVSGSSEAFVFEVSAVKGVDCTATFRQSCNSCILAANGDDENAEGYHPGCSWCDSTQECRDADAMQSCECDSCDPNPIVTDTSNCAAPAFSNIQVMTLENEVKESFPIGSTVKIVWDSTAVSASNMVNIHLLYYDSKDSTQTKEDGWDTCTDYMNCNNNNAWPQQSMTVANSGSAEIELFDAYEAKWVLKVEYCEGLSYCVDTGIPDIITEVSNPFIMQYEYDACTTSQNDGFANGKFTDAYFQAQMECYMDQCREIDTAHEFYDDCALLLPDNPNTASINTCLCYHEKMESIGTQTAQRVQGKALFDTFLKDCDHESSGSPYYMPGNDWCQEDGGGDGSSPGDGSDNYYSSSTGAGTAEKQSQYKNQPCGPPPANCKNFTVVAELFDWAVEAHWEIELPAKGNSPGCFRAMAGPWDIGGEYEKTVCLTDGDWKIVGYDSYGDGWNGGGKLSILDAAGAFKVSPTNVEGSSTAKEFTVSSAKCQHSTCGTCVSDDGGDANCVYCSGLAKPICMDKDGDAYTANPDSCGAESGRLFLEGDADAEAVCNAFTSTISLKGPVGEDGSVTSLGKLIGGENTTIIEWDSENIGGSVAVELILYTNSYVCSDYDGEGCSSTKEYEITAGTPQNRGNDIDASQQEPADPGGKSFVWKIDPMYPSGDDWMLKARVRLGATEIIEDTLGPFTIEQPCVDIVIVTEAIKWSQEIEFKLWDGISAEPILYAHNDPDTTVDPLIPHDVFANDKTTLHYNGGSYDCDADEEMCIESPVLCLLPGPYILEAIDTYGDGWNGGGNIKVKKAANDVTFAGPLYPEGLSTSLDVFVTPPEDIDQADLCPYYEGCGACREGSCGWCLATGKCTASGGSCDGLYISTTACPTNIQVPNVDAKYQVGDSISIKWTGTGFTTYSSTTVSMFKGSPADCGEDSLGDLDAFLDCQYIDWQFDFNTNVEMVQGGPGFETALTWSRFVNDNDYFIVVSSNVEDGVFGYSGAIEIEDPNAGLCSGSKVIDLTHSSLVEAANLQYGQITEGFLTDGSGTAQYDDDMACDWTINAPPGYNVFLSFLDVELETGCYDRITIRDGDNSASPVRAYVCAPTSADTDYVEAASQKSVGQSMHVSFQTDELGSSGGFEAVVTVVAAPGAGDGEGDGAFNPNPCTDLDGCNGCDEDGDGNAVDGTSECAWAADSNECRLTNGDNHCQIAEGEDDESEGEIMVFPSCANGPRQGNGMLTRTVDFSNAESAKGTLFSGYNLQLDDNKDCTAMADDESKCLYDVDMDCTWNLEARLGYVIELEFQYFHLEPQRTCDYDYVEITDTDNPLGDGKQSGNVKYCGTNLPPVFTSIGNKVQVQFKSDDTIPFGGFVLKYTSYMALPSRRRTEALPAPVPETLEEINGTLMPAVGAPVDVADNKRKLAAAVIPQYCEEETTINLDSTDNKGSISDGIANAYKPKTNCRFIINSADSDMGIKLDFESFHVEGGEGALEGASPCEYDFVKISNEHGDVLGKICGRKNNADGYIYSTCSEGVDCTMNKFTGPSTSVFYTRTQKLIVEFQTDDSVELAGFHANAKLLPISKMDEKGLDETRNWVYSGWSECVPLRFGFNEGRRTRDVSCGFDSTSTEMCPEHTSFKALEDPSEEDHPTENFDCSVEGSGLRWSGEYFVENIGCTDVDFCCFDGHFKVKQKNSDQKNSIHITNLIADGPQRKCELYEGDSADYGTGENIYFPLDGEGDNAKNEGTFIVYGIEYTVLKSGSFMEFKGNDQGISLGNCEGGDCVPKEMDLAKLLTIVGLEAVVVVGLLLLWFIYRSVNTDKAKNQALSTAKKAEASKAEMNDMVAKKMERAMQLAATKKKKSSKKLSTTRKASSDDMSLLEGEDFGSFEGVDLCGMQKLQKIDKRNPQDRKIIQAFNKADTDGSGFIDADELLRAMIETTGKPWTMTQIDEIMKEFDDDGNGELGVEEFKLLVNSTAGGSLNFNRNKYSPDDYNAPYQPPSFEVAEEFARSELPKVPEGHGEELWAKEFCLTRILFGDKKKELMPIWITDIDDCDFGVGISLYFKNLLFLCYMLFGAFLLALPIMISNSMQQSSALAVQLQGSFVSSESLHIGAGVTDLVICLLLALVLILADEKEKKLIAKIDAGVQTPADYTLMMKNAPPLPEVSLGQWRKYFEDITKGMVREKDEYVPEDRDLVEDGSVEDGKVVSISYCVKGAREIYNLVKQRRALEDKLYFKVRALKRKDPEYKLPVASHLDPPTAMQKVFCAGSIEPAFLLSEIDSLDKKINSFQMSEKPKMGSRMFVTFDTELALDTACVESFKNKGPTGKCPKVKQACEASDLIYSNLATGIWNRRVREFLGYLICFGLILGSLAILVYLNEQRINPTYAGYAVAFANGFLKVFCEFWVKNVERPLTYSDQQFSLMTKLTAARVFNTAILLLFTCDRSKVNDQYLYLNTEFVAKVQSTIQADITLSLARVVDGPRIAKRILARFAKPATQSQLNKFYEPTKWNLAERYSDSIKTLFTCLFYVSVLPTGLGYATIAFAIAYCSDKYCIMRTWKRPPEFDYKMSVIARYILEWTLCAHLFITWYLYRKWPFVEIETEVEKVYTPDQAVLVFIYGFATLGSAAFFGAKQFGNVLTALITDAVGEQRCERSCIVRWCACLRPPEQKYHIERYSQLAGYGLSSYNPHPEDETAADFESFHVINNIGERAESGIREKVLAPRIVAFMPKSEPSEFSTVNKKVDIVEDKKFTVVNEAGGKYKVDGGAAVASGAAGGEVELLALAKPDQGKSAEANL